MSRFLVLVLLALALAGCAQTVGAQSTRGPALATSTPTVSEATVATPPDGFPSVTSADPSGKPVRLTTPTAGLAALPTATSPSRESPLHITQGSTVALIPLIVGDGVIPDPAQPAKSFALRRCDIPGDCLPLQNQTLHIVLSPDGRYVLYESFQTGGVLHGTATPVPGTRVTPTLRLLDLQTGQDRLYVAGAWGPVWGADGRVAYTRGVDPAWTLDAAYPSQVVVRSSLDAPASVWTSTPGRFRCLAWAGPRLICQEGGYPPSGKAFPDDLLIFSGRDSFVPLGLPQPTLVAISPDGARALVTSLAVQGDGLAVAHLVDLASGQDISALKLPATLENLATDGEWLGNRIVAAHGWSPNRDLHPAPGLAILAVDGNRLTLEHVYTFGPRVILGGGPFAQVSQPRFVGRDLAHVGMLWGSRGYLDCHLDAARCLLGPELAGRVAFIGNPSRPSSPSAARTMPRTPRVSASRHDRSESRVMMTVTREE